MMITTIETDREILENLTQLSSEDILPHYSQLACYSNSNRSIILQSILRARC